MSKKHYIVTSITLGVIGACSAGLIGLANLVTRDKISANEQNKIQVGITSIFGDSASIDNEYELHDNKYTNYVYEIKISDVVESYAFRTTGSNMYGKISLLVGINKTYLLSSSNPVFSFVNLYVITNEQTYASTLVDNYIIPLNDGDRSLDDVSCGATYGAKLVRDMVEEAKTVADKVFGEDY